MLRERFAKTVAREFSMDSPPCHRPDASHRGARIEPEKIGHHRDALLAECPVNTCR
jgi:hypothetical protein